MLTLSDRSISFTAVLAALGWMAGLALIVVDIFIPSQLAALGLLIAGAGGVLTIRTYFCDAAARERNAFELGRDSTRVEHLTSLR